MILAVGFFRSLVEWEFMRLGLITGIFIGFLAPLVGSVAVIKRLSLIADTLSHFSLAGVAIGVFLSKLISPNIIPINPIYMGMVFSVIGTFIIEKLRGFYKNYKELSMPIVMSLGVALSGLFIAITPGISTQFTTDLLYGNILSVERTDLYVIMAVSVPIIVFFVIFYKKIVTLCFDEVYAKISGINVRMFQLFLTLIMAVIISIFIDIVGVLLISALLIIPVASAILTSSSFIGTLIHAIIYNELSILIGLYIAYYLKWPTSSTVVLINILILLLIMIVSRIRHHFIKEENLKEHEHPSQ